ncbi:MAG: hypothetical protein AB8H79_06420 [Myxococcota bacterium]
MPRTIDGVETEGMLLVVESGDALIRAAGPLVKGQSLWTVLGSAFTDPPPPPPGSPSRPKRVLTSDRALVQRLNQALKGVGVKVVFAPTLPGVEHVAGSMASHFGPVEAPGITTDMVRWGSATSQWANGPRCRKHCYALLSPSFLAFAARPSRSSRPRSRWRVPCGTQS